MFLAQQVSFQKIFISVNYNELCEDIYSAINNEVVSTGKLDDQTNSMISLEKRKNASEISRKSTGIILVSIIIGVFGSPAE